MQQTPTHYKWSKSVRQRLNLDTSDTALGSSPLMKTFRTVQMNLMESESFIVPEESIDISGQKRLNDPTVPPDEISLNALAAFMRIPEVKILEQLKAYNDNAASRMAVKKNPNEIQQAAAREQRYANRSQGSVSQILHQVPDNTEACLGYAEMGLASISKLFKLGRHAIGKSHL